MRRTDILERKNDILQWIREERPKSYICNQLHCKPETLNSYLNQMGIVYVGQQNKKGQQKGPNKYKPASYYFDNMTTWQGLELPLELHHINGNHYDNRLENLQILCPNCHAIQPGNAGANIGKHNDL